MNISFFTFTGAVRTESFTRLPPPLHPASMTDHHSAGDSTECVPNTTEEEEDVSDNADPIVGGNTQDEDDDEGELLQRLATRHYYSYTAALGVTVGVGCVLLVLNMLLFAGIYYQRDKERRRHSNNATTNSNQENIPMSQHTNSNFNNSPPSTPDDNRKEFPPSYATVPRCTSPNKESPNRRDEFKKNKAERPQPPVRTSSNPPGGTIKKRVQIQEISV